MMTAKKWPDAAPTAIEPALKEPAKGKPKSVGEHIGMDGNDARPHPSHGIPFYADGYLETHGKFINAAPLRERLKQMTPSQLHAVYGALRSASDAFYAATNQPRCEDNAAGEVLDMLGEELSCASVLVINEALTRDPAADEHRHVIALVLEYEILCCDDPLEVAKLAMRFVSRDHI